MQSEAEGGRDAVLRDRLGIDPHETERSLAEAYWPLAGLSGPLLTLYLDLAESKGGAKASEAGYQLKLAAGRTGCLSACPYSRSGVPDTDGKPKADSSLYAKAMVTAAPQLADAVAQAREHVVACRRSCGSRACMRQPAPHSFWPSD